MSLSPRGVATLQAVVVTVLWATSWVLIKLGLHGTGGPAIPPLTFAGLRYVLASLCLLPFALGPRSRTALRGLAPAGWLRLAGLGFLFYTLTHGAQFVALSGLPAATLNLVLNFSPAAVALLGWACLGERPARPQWAGLAIALAGAAIFFSPSALQPGAPLAYAAAVVGLVANAASAIVGRAANRDGDLSPLLVTTVSMACGAALLLAAGLAWQGLPRLTLGQWGLVAWLAVVNTALAFTLWNHTLRTLTAVESSVINSLLVVQIPLLAWVFLGEALSAVQIIGLALAGVGVLVVQVRRGSPATATPPLRPAPPP